MCLFIPGPVCGQFWLIWVRPRGWQQSDSRLYSWQVRILVKWASDSCLFIFWWGGGGVIGVRPRGWQQSVSWQVGILVKWAWSSGQFWAIGVRPRGWQQSVSWQVGILVKWAWSSGQFWAIGVRPRGWQQSVSWQVGILVKWAWSSGQFWAIGVRPRGWQQSVSNLSYICSHFPACIYVYIMSVDFLWHVGSCHLTRRGKGSREVRLEISFQIVLILSVTSQRSEKRNLLSVICSSVQGRMYLCAQESP